MPSLAVAADPGRHWGLIGQSPAVHALIARVHDAARLTTGVLVSGEAGTGRSLVARAIHDLSHEQRAPFVAVRCDSDDPVALERRLFGALRDAHHRHGAHADEPDPRGTHEHVMPGSLLHDARGGTIFFRHLEELPERIQARLAHLFRDNEAIVGRDGPPQAFAVRPMASAEPGFDEQIHSGRVRGDLYRRLARTRIEVPPLRERREDIPALAAYFITRACERAGVEPRVLTPSAQAVMAALPWRGNGRELRGVIDALVLHGHGAEIRLESLLAILNLDAGAPAAGRAATPVVGTLREARARWEREYITAVLAQYRGRIPDAARALGIQRTNLYRKLRALHVRRNGRGRGGGGRSSPGPAQS